MITLVIAFALVVVVVFIFLGSIRATLIPAIAVPVSVIGTFAALLAMGYSANTISLLAMVLAIGILVDDAIVVVENVERVMEEEPGLSPADATKKAMTEITAPIIAITLVLLSVFVPIAFIPGISGTLFRQFAVTISVAMLISALNALTLSPALCAVFLRHGGPKRVLRRIDNIRDGYAAVVRRLLRVAILGVVLILASAAGIFGLSLRMPTGFLPEEDQGAFFISVQLPDGASVARTSEVVRRIEALVKQMPQVQNLFSVIGYSILDSLNEPNAAFIVPTLKPFADRVSAANSAQALIARVFAEGQQVRTASVIPFNLPPIIGLSTTGGFEYEIEGLEGQEPAAMNSVMQGLLAATNRDPRLTRVFSTYTANSRQHAAVDHIEVVHAVHPAMRIDRRIRRIVPRDQRAAGVCRPAERDRLDDRDHAGAQEVEGERPHEAAMLVARRRDAVAIIIEPRPARAVRGDDAVVRMRAVLRLQEEAVGALADKIGDPARCEGRQLGCNAVAFGQRGAERLNARVREAIVSQDDRLAQEIALAPMRPSDHGGEQVPLEVAADGRRTWEFVSKTGGCEIVCKELRRGERPGGEQG